MCCKKGSITKKRKQRFRLLEFGKRLKTSKKAHARYGKRPTRALDVQALRKRPAYIRRPTTLVNTASNNTKMARWFRSEHMEYISLIVNEDAAHDCLADLGKLSAIQFTDVSVARLDGLLLSNLHKANNCMFPS